MTSISSVDRLVLILRERLTQRTRTKSSERPSVGQQGAAPPGPDAIHALAAIASVDDHQLKRALVQGVLVESLGAHLINEARFQQVVEQVANALEADPSTGRLLDRFVKDLRSGVR
jgi:hypothetical protein